MKIASTLLSISACSASNSDTGGEDADASNPIAKILSILADCESKIIKEGEETQKTYEEYSEWCERESKNVGYEVKTGKAQVEELKATIEKETSNIDAYTTSIEELAGEIAADEKDLAAATKVREAEAADFKAAEKELTEVIDSLNRAIGLIEREMAKGASMVQLKSAKTMEQAFSALVQASVFSSADVSRLTALVQNSQDSEDTDSDLGAPDAAAYESKSGGIVDTLQDLLDKAESQLSDAQKKETAAKNNFEMLKQSLEDEIKYANKEKAEASKNLAASEEGKATAEGDLDVTQKDLAEDIATLGNLHHECLTAAQNFEAETTSRGEELKAINVAKQALRDASAGAAASFLQVVSNDAPSKLVVHFLRNLAKKQQDQALAQLASRVASAARLSGSLGVDPFAKIKELITNMITNLESQAKEDANHKAYCDKEMGETKQKKVDKSAEVEHLSTKIEQQSSASAKLKEEVNTLQKELADLAKSQASMDQLRAEEKAAYEATSTEMKQGLEGVKIALKVLRDYYSKAGKAHGAQEGGASGVIGMLEVVESDFSKGLAEITAVEDQAARDYTMQTKENEVSKKTKEQDVKYKTKEFTGLDKSVAELTSDREGAQEELDAVLQALQRLEDMCIAKPESYADRAARRDAEIAGLREALGILESESAFVQRRSLRGRVHVRRM